MKFYNVRKKTAVEVPDEKCTKRVYTKRDAKGNLSDKKTYGVTAIDDDGTKLTKFVKKELFDKLPCPEAK